MKSRFLCAMAFSVLLGLGSVVPAWGQPYSVPIRRLATPQGFTEPTVGNAGAFCQIDDPSGEGGILFSVDEVSATTDPYYSSNGVGAPLQAFGEVGYTETTANASCLNIINALDTVGEVDTLVTAKASISGGGGQTGSSWLNFAASEARYRVETHQSYPQDQGTQATLRGSIWLACVGPDPAGIGNAEQNQVFSQIGASWLRGTFSGGVWTIDGVLQRSSQADPDAEPETIQGLVIGPSLDNLFEFSQVVTIGTTLVDARAVIWNANAQQTSLGATGGALPALHPFSDYNLSFKATGWFDVIKQ